MNLKKHVSPHGTVMAMSMMKDEAPFLLEWFAHHLAVGFTDILVYTNNCTDGTDEMLQRLEELGLGYHRPNVIKPGVKPQPSALSHGQAEPLVQDADWLLVFDADEFLAINHPSGTLDGMLDDAVAKDANGIVITWRIFGSNGIVDWSRAPVTEQYTRAAPPDWNKGWGVKTLFRFDPEYWKLGIHRPSIKNKHLEDGFPDTVRWLNGSGQPMEDYFKFHGWRSIKRTIGYNWAQMNHYAVKSVDSYALRKFRGNVNNKADKYNADYWALQDRNEVPDTRILRHAPARAAIMAELLTDPVLRELHETALARVEARLAEYRETDAYRELREGLIAAGRVPIANVEAKPPKPRDPTRIAELMNRVRNPGGPSAEDTDQPASRPAPSATYITPVDLSTPLEVEWFPNRELQLPADPRIFTAEALSAIRAGKFERRHARNLPGYLEGCRRLLDIGGGVGFPVMGALRALPRLTVMLHEDRPGLAAAARLIHRRNGMEDTARLRVVDGPLRLASDQELEASGLAACLRDFRPDALRLSCPEAVPPDMLAAMPLDTVKRVIVAAAAGEEMGTAYADALAGAGFRNEVESAAGGPALFVRQ
ncbi:glycosyltransferase family 2 protein [Paracoccus sp. (in: a-proteobacteria)]|uniref:glycosyltransferase family 2 protein n=1 Tax=Paracoccus sp. TaxID=267 RepID=UPI0026E02ABE|nr:glycosyltransferase family 2 protein [Paracoccus sp. (in: a-proteobacteria)]MDO5370436.1 glycosyltransferase family 2 protein [Paracoccus sp. (in: a-proteobacteria)]